MCITLKALPVNGESILITTPDFVLLIDGGTEQTDFEQTRDILKEAIIATGRNIDLIILTHTDKDHIGGLIELLKIYKKLPFTIKKIWFNTLEKIEIVLKKEDTIKTSYKHAEAFHKLIENLGIDINKEDINTSNFPKKFFLSPSLSIHILSPTQKSLNNFYEKWDQSRFLRDNIKTAARGNDYKKTLEQLCNEQLDKKDTSIPNGSSIAFILEYKNRKFLFTGDAFAEIICDSLTKIKYSEINPLYVDIFKLSHHGSAYNINLDLIKMVQARNYLVCASGMDSFPAKKTLAHIVKIKNEKIKVLSTKCLRGIFLANRSEIELFELKILDKEISFE